MPFYDIYVQALTKNKKKRLRQHLHSKVGEEYTHLVPPTPVKKLQ